VAQVAEFDRLLAGTEQDRVAGFLRQITPRRFHIELVVLGQRTDHLEEVRIATVPAAHGALAKAALGVRDYACRIEELGDAEAVAGRTGADRRVEREQPRLQLRQRVVALRAGIAR
jgi:hypothetical protein